MPGILPMMCVIDNLKDYMIAYMLCFPLVAISERIGPAIDIALEGTIK